MTDHNAETVERVARAIYKQQNRGVDKWAEASGIDRVIFCAFARAAISAIPVTVDDAAITKARADALREAADKAFPAADIDARPGPMRAAILALIPDDNQPTKTKDNTWNTQ